MLPLLSAPAQAQNTNPTPDPDCGLPKGLSGQRRIYSDVTYTLTGDCQQDWRLSCDIPSTSEEPAATITVNGGGNTIKAFKDNQGFLDVFSLTGKCAISLNNVTIEGGGYQGRAAIQLTHSDIASSFNNVTFTNTYYTALSFDDQRENNSPGTTHTLSNVLIKDTSGSYVVARHGIPSGIQVIGTVNLNINNLALRNVRGGNSAIGANDTFIVGRTVSLGTITLTGCLTIDGVFPRVYYGNIVDNAPDPCSGTIGNGGSSAMQYPQAQIDPSCGLPLSGFIYGNHVYNLKSDCALSGTLYIPYESDVVINGNDYTIAASAAGEAAIAVAGKFSLKNAVISGAAGSPVVSYLDKKMSIADASFRDNMGPLRFQDSVMTLERVTIERHSVSAAGSPSAVSVEKSARVIICDSVFRGNSGGQGALFAGASFTRGDPSTTLRGYVTFESNSPDDIVDPDSLLIDSRGGACSPSRTIRGNPTVTTTDSSGCNPHNCPPPVEPVCKRQDKIEALPVGVIACIFRYDQDGETIMHIYEINRATSSGFHALTLRQSQLAALDGEQIVAVSGDGRVLVVVWPDDNVTVKVGPNQEGKILHTTFADGLYGHVIDTRTTYGDAPGLPYINLALPYRILPGQAVAEAQQRPAALDCMVTTQYILNLRDAPGGEVMNILPYNVTLTVTDRAEGWFKVDYHGEAGWLSADYVTPEGRCR